MSRFRVALSGDFRKPDGSPTYPSFDLTPLTRDPAVETVFVDAVDGVMPQTKEAIQHAKAAGPCVFMRNRDPHALMTISIEDSDRLKLSASQALALAIVS